MITAEKGRIGFGVAVRMGERNSFDDELWYSFELVCIIKKSLKGN